MPLIKKLFRVHVTVSYDAAMLVEADNREEAKFLAEAKHVEATNVDYSQPSIATYDVVEIE